MPRLVHQGQSCAPIVLFHRGPLQLSQGQPDGGHQLGVGGAVFHGHRLAAMEHHGQPGGHQHQGREGQQGSIAAAPIEGHPKAHFPALHRWQGWPQLAIGLEHAGHLLGLGAPQAMGDQKGAHLLRAGQAPQDAFNRLARLPLAEAGAGALPAAKFGQQLSKPTRGCAELHRALMAALPKELLEMVGRQHGGTDSRCNPGS